MHTKIGIIVSIVIIALLGILYTKTRTPGFDGFTKLTQADPLFYSPFLDQKTFAASIQELIQAEKDLKAITIHNLEQSKENYARSYIQLVRDTPLFPTDFLATLPTIAQQTEDYIANPTPSKARQLLTAYTEAQQAYEKAAAALVTTYADIDAHIPDDRPVYYFFTDSATSVSIAQRDFSLIYKNALALKDEITKRKNCLYNNTDCTIPEIQSAPIASGTTTVPMNKNSTFIRENLPFGDTERAVQGPYPIQSNCWESTTKTPQPTYLIYSTKDNRTMVLPKLATQNYYRLVSPQAPDAISKKLTEMGLPFYSQVEGTTYECTDLTFYPEILTLDFIQKNGISSSTDLLTENKFGLLAPAFFALVDYTHILTTSQKISTDFVLSPQFLFTTRSAYSLTYLPFAQSVWRITEQPQYLLSQENYMKLGAPAQYKTLDELQKSGTSEATLKKSHINQNEFINSLVK